MADEQGTRRERARNHPWLDRFEHVDLAARLASVRDRARAPEAPATCAADLADRFAGPEGRSRAYYERFVPRYVIEGLLADIRGARRHRAADGSSVAFPMSP